MNTFRTYLKYFLTACFLLASYTFVKVIRVSLQKGVLVVDAYPSGGSVFINGKLVSEKTPAEFLDMDPGHYELRVQRKGYRVWQDEIQVAKGQVTKKDNVFLLPGESALQEVSPLSFDVLLPVKGTPYLVLIDEADLNKSKVYDAEEDKFHPLFSGEKAEDKERYEHLYTMEGSAFAVLKTSVGNASHYYQFNLETRPVDVVNISEWIPGKIVDLLWSPENPQLLFSCGKNMVNQINLEKGTVQVFAEDWVGVGVMNNKLCGIDEKGRFLIKNFQGGVEDAEVTELEIEKNLFGNSDYVRIWPLHNGTVLLHGAGGSLLQSELPHLLAESDIEGLNRNVTHNIVLVWKEHELGLYRDTPLKTPGKVFAEGQKIHWFYQHDKRITDAFFIYDSQHVLCVTENEVQVISISGTKRSTVELFPILEGSRVAFVPETGWLYSLHPEKHTLIRLPVLTEKKPEPLITLLPEPREDA